MSATNPTSPKESLWKRTLRFWFGFEPIHHAPWETLMMRLGVAIVTWVTVKDPALASGQPKPHGIANWLDLSWVASADTLGWVTPVIAIMLILYVLGIAVPVVLLPVLFVSIAQGTLPNSQGAIGHTTQIITLVLIAQWLASVWFIWRTMRKPPTLDSYNGAQLMADWARQMVAATYVGSALTKLWESGGTWIQDSPYFGLQIVKSTEMGYYNYLQKPGNAEWMGQFLVDHPMVAQFAIGAGLPLELFAFLALLNRRIALVYGICLIIFHSTVSEIMHLGFLYNKWLLLILFVNPLWWLAEGVKKMLPKQPNTNSELPAAS